MMNEHHINRKATARADLAMVPLVVAGLLAGCFGGGGDDSGMPSNPSANEVPDSALTSSAAYTQFTLTTSQSSSETVEPLLASKVGTPPSSETDEPVTVP